MDKSKTYSGKSEVVCVRNICFLSFLNMWFFNENILSLFLIQCYSYILLLMFAPYQSILFDLAGFELDGIV